jgi:hypothetical protein
MFVLCSGISIVWSAVDGVIIVLFYEFQLKLRLFESSDAHFLFLSLCFAWLYSLILWIYYATTDDFLTTIAHLCALLLGLLIGKILIFFSFSDLPLTRNENIDNPYSPIIVTIEK